MKTLKFYLVLFILAAFSLCAPGMTLAENADIPACYGDLDTDGDVDGKDLTAWLDLFEEQAANLEILAGHYGQTRCPAVSEIPVTITYDGSSVIVDNPFEDAGVMVDVDRADVTVTSTAGIDGIVFILAGATPDGMFKIYSLNDFSLRLNSVEITNSDGPAINIQADETISVELAGETASILTDGAAYADPPNEEDQKAAFFSEGQLLFSGQGSLDIYCAGDDQHGLGSDDYIEVNSGEISILGSTKDGIHTNEGYYQTGGTVIVDAGTDGVDAGDGPVYISGGGLDVLITDDDRDGIKCDSDIRISGGQVSVTVEGDQSKGMDAENILLEGGTITINTSGDVVLEASEAGFDPSYCTAIKAKTQVLLDGAELVVNTTGDAGRGISTKGDILVYSGSVEMTSSGSGGTYFDEEGILDAYHGPCMKADGNVVIQGGRVLLSHSGNGGRGITCDGQLTVGTTASSPVLEITTTGQEITVGWDDATEAKAIKSEGKISIENGDIVISSADDAIKSDTWIEISGGRIDIQDSLEGIEAPDIDINGGDIRITSTDDGVNATNGEDVEGDDGSTLNISDGYLAIFAPSGDGIDSNGSLTVDGGTVVVHGPPGQPDVGIDVNGAFVMNGGFLVVAQITSNMVETPVNTSTQNSVLLQRQTQHNPRSTAAFPNDTSLLSAGTLFHIRSTSGETLLTFAPEYNYSSILFSSPDLANSTSYQVYTGGSCTGSATDGLYSGGTYSGGTLQTTFSYPSSGSVVTVNF